MPSSSEKGHALLLGFRTQPRGGPSQSRSKKKGVGQGSLLRVAWMGQHPRVRPRVWSRALVQKPLQRYCDEQCNRNVDGVPFVSEAVSSPRWTRRATATGGVCRSSAGAVHRPGGCAVRTWKSCLFFLFVFVSDSHCSVSGLRSPGLLFIGFLWEMLLVLPYSAALGLTVDSPEMRQSTEASGRISRT